MGFLDWFRRKPKPAPVDRKPETDVRTDLPPKTQEPVRVIDTNKGSVTIRGDDAWKKSGGGSSGGGGGSSQIVSVKTELSTEQTQQVLGSRGFEQAYISPADGKMPVSAGKIQAVKEKTASPLTYTPAPTWEETKPKTLWGKTKLATQMAWTMSPFGLGQNIPEEYHEKRFDGMSKYLGGALTPNEAFEAVKAQKLKEARAQQQIGAIQKFNIEVEQAPEELKYDVYQRGVLELTQYGIYPDEVDGKLNVSSTELKPSRSSQDYMYEEGNKVGKVLGLTQTFSSGASSVYLGGLAIGTGMGAIGIPKLAAAFPKTSKVIGTGLKVGLGGAYVGSTGYSLAITPPEKRAVLMARTFGQVTGAGLLYGQASEAKKYAKEQRAIQYRQTQRYEHLKNVKQYGQYSKYSKLGYEQAGTGKQLNYSARRTLARQMGVSQSQIRSASLYRQTMRVKSPAGFKTYKTGKWGISVSQRFGSAGKSEIATTFRFYRGKPTSFQTIFTAQKGAYAFSKVYQPSGKGFKTSRFITKVSDFKQFKIGSVKTYSYKTTTKIVPKGYTAKSFKQLWTKVPSSLTTSTFSSGRIEIPAWQNIRGMRVAKEGSFIFGSRGTGLQFLATESLKINAQLGYSTKKYTLGPEGFSKATYKDWAKTFGRGSSSQQLQPPKNIPKVVSSSWISPTINTLDITTVKPASGVQVTSTGILGGLLTGSGSQLSTGSRGRTSIGPIVRPIDKSISATNIRPIQSTTTATSPIQFPRSSGTPIFPVIPIIGGGTPGTPPPPGQPIQPGIFAFPSFGGGIGGTSSGKVPAKQTFRYTPSYTALVYGIKGKQPKQKRFTGFEVRPITKEWTQMFKPKYKRRKSKWMNKLFI